MDTYLELEGHLVLIPTFCVLESVSFKRVNIGTQGKTSGFDVDVHTNDCRTLELTL